MSPLLLDVLLAFGHHLLVFALVAVLVAELVLASTELLDARRLAQLGRLDAAYGGLAGGVVVVGLLRAVFGAKGWSFYAGNPLFWAKLGLFVAIGLLSIVPTARLIRWRRAGTLPDAATLRGTRAWMLAQVVLLAVMPLLAVLMARGVGR